MKHPRFDVGRIYTRQRDLMLPFGGQRQGGISTPKRFPLVFAFTGHTGRQHGYADGWTPNGVFQYCGEGQVGDMAFVRGNRALRDHVANGRELHLFENLRKTEVRYLGQFFVGGCEDRRLPDRNGDLRRGIIFNLVPIDTLQPESDPDAPQPVPGASATELRARAYAAAIDAPAASAREARRAVYERSEAVRRYVLARASGRCELCGCPAPFTRSNGTPYLEPHHIRQLSDGGPDDPRFVAGICPTCHRRIHHGMDGNELNQHLAKTVEDLEAVWV